MLVLFASGVAHGGTLKWIKKKHFSILFFVLFVKHGIFHLGASRGAYGPSYLGLCWWRCHIVG